MTPSPLDTLLEVQARDTAIDRLRHRRETLESRAAYRAAVAAAGELDERHAAVTARLDDVMKVVTRLDDEASGIKEHAAGVEVKLYSGETTSPRELQALQADLDQLRRQQRGVEDRELEAMEVRETIDTERTAIEAELQKSRAEAASRETILTDDETAIDAELEREQSTRDDLVTGVAASLIELYERCRGRARGIGVARLVGSTCQGCRLTIPATEVDRIKHAPAGAVAHCDNCGAILVA